MNDGDTVLVKLLGLPESVCAFYKDAAKVAKVFSKGLAGSGYCRNPFQIFFCLEENCHYFHWAIVWEL